MPRFKTVAILFFTAVAPAFAAAAPVPGRAEIDTAMQELSSITGFPVRHPVVFESITRDKVNQFLQERIKEVVKPAELEAEERTLKKFGFVPADFDLKRTTIDLLTEQAAAFYDFHRKKLFIADWASSEMRNVALVHELAHALADQNYSLDKFTKKGQKDSEKSLARQAVVEGQASWLMSEVMARRMGRTLSNQQVARELLTGSSEPSGGQYPVFDNAPLYLRETLLFPYTRGQQFQQAVYNRSGQAAFAGLFRSPPVSTQQILHPDLYFRGMQPVSPKLPRSPKGMRGIVQGSLGELDHSILLRQYTSKEAADEVSPHWKGASYRLFESKADKRAILFYSSEWSGPEIAQRFFSLYQEVLAHKWKSMEVISRSDSRVTGRGDDGYFVLTLEGSTVSSQEGWSGPR